MTAQETLQAEMIIENDSFGIAALFWGKVAVKFHVVELDETDGLFYSLGHTNDFDEALDYFEAFTVQQEVASFDFGF